MEIGSLAAWASVALVVMGGIFKLLQKQAQIQKQQSPGSMKKIQEYVELAKELNGRPEMSRQLRQVDELLEWELDRYTIGEAVRIDMHTQVQPTSVGWDIATMISGAATPIFMWGIPEVSWMGWITLPTTAVMIVGPYILPHLMPKAKRRDMKDRSKRLQEISKRLSWRIK